LWCRRLACPCSRDDRAIFPAAAVFSESRKRLFLRRFRDFLNFFRRLSTEETPFFLVFEKAISRFLESCAVFWAELLPMVFFSQFAGGIAYTGIIAEDANRFRRLLPISGYQWLLVFLHSWRKLLGTLITTDNH
jgi:hypothetical protein